MESNDTWNDEWWERAACRIRDCEKMFVTGANQNEAKQRCRFCPVQTECLADALDSRMGHGVWGGMTERERRALLARRPDVLNWRALLKAARQGVPVPASALNPSARKPRPERRERRPRIPGRSPAEQDSHILQALRARFAANQEHHISLTGLAEDLNTSFTAMRRTLERLQTAGQLSYAVHRGSKPSLLTLHYSPDQCTAAAS